MAHIVIADAGPLIAFAAVDVLFVLKQLFSNVVITGSVQIEYSSKPGADTRRLDAAIVEGWLVVKSAGVPSRPLSPSLGIGESDSIRLAMENADGSLLIMDDRLARRYALRNRLNVVGTVRLLDLAERRGLIGSAEQEEISSHRSVPNDGRGAPVCENIGVLQPSRSLEHLSMAHPEKDPNPVHATDDAKPSTFLCEVDAIAEPGSLGFDLDGDDGGLFVVRHDGGVFAYRNNCPHTGSPLDWTPDQFLDPDGALIQCAMHGALFSIETGECLHGPCVGASLEPLPIQVIDGRVHLLESGISSTE